MSDEKAAARKRWQVLVGGGAGALLISAVWIGYSSEIQPGIEGLDAGAVIAVGSAMRDQAQAWAERNAARDAGAEQVSDGGTASAGETGAPVP